jgi:hypothetical protein
LSICVRIFAKDNITLFVIKIFDAIHLTETRRHKVFGRTLAFFVVTNAVRTNMNGFVTSIRLSTSLIITKAATLKTNTCACAFSVPPICRSTMKKSTAFLK